MRVQHQSTKSFLGTHKGSTIEIDSEPDGRFYIRVYSSAGHGYDGWAPDHVTNMKQAKVEALRGACIE